MLQSLAKEFGVPLTQHELEELRRKAAAKEEEEKEKRKREEEAEAAAGGGAYKLASREAGRMFERLKKVWRERGREKEREK